MGARGQRTGFTLVELMVVLTIMGIMVGLAAPTMSAAMADRRVGRAARDIVRIYRQARYSSMAYGRAYGVAYYYNPVTVFPMPAWSKNWRFKVYRGTNAGCLRNTWDFMGASDGPRLVASIQLTDYDPDVSDDDSIAVEAWNYQFLCYEGGSSNRLWRSQVFSHGWTMSGRGGIGLAISRVVLGEPRGVMRKVFVPFGASIPRMMR